MTIFSPKILEALEFAAVAHHGQYRKAEFDKKELPYFAHPAAVGLLLGLYGFSEETIVAGILHDIVEDTSYSSSELESRFGPKVASIVRGVTEDKNLVWEERQRAYNDALKSQTTETLAVSIADLVTNRMALLSVFQTGHNPWPDVAPRGPENYANRRIWYDDDRIAIAKERLSGPLIEHAEQVVADVKMYTQKAQW